MLLQKITCLKRKRGWVTVKLEIILLGYKGHRVRMDKEFYGDFNEMLEDMLRYILK